MHLFCPPNYNREHRRAFVFQSWCASLFSICSSLALPPARSHAWIYDGQGKSKLRPVCSSHSERLCPGWLYCARFYQLLILCSRGCSWLPALVWWASSGKCLFVLLASFPIFPSSLQHESVFSNCATDYVVYWWENNSFEVILGTRIFRTSIMTQTLQSLDISSTVLGITTGYGDLSLRRHTVKFSCDICSRLSSAKKSKIRSVVLVFIATNYSLSSSLLETFELQSVYSFFYSKNEFFTKNRQTRPSIGFQLDNFKQYVVSNESVTVGKLG